MKKNQFGILALLLFFTQIHAQSGPHKLHTLINEIVENLGKINIDYLDPEGQVNYLKAQRAAEKALQIIGSSKRRFSGSFETMDDGKSADNGEAERGAEAEALKKCSNAGAMNCHIVDETSRAFKTAKSGYWNGYPKLWYTSHGAASAEGDCIHCKEP